MKTIAIANLWIGACALAVVACSGAGDAPVEQNPRPVDPSGSGSSASTDGTSPLGDKPDAGKSNGNGSGGTNADAAGGSGPDAGGDETGGATSGGGSCSISLPAELGFGACGGPGGGTFDGRNEIESNDATPETIDLGTPVCGATKNGDTDRFALDVSAGDCLVVSFHASTASIAIAGPGVAVTASGSRTFKLQATHDGRLAIAVTGTASDAYDVTVR